MRIGQTSVVVFGSQLLSSVFGFAATVYFARTLGAEVLGYYALVLVIAKWVKLAGDAGVANAVTKRMSEETAPGSIFTAGLIILAVFAGVCSISIIALQEVINNYVGTDVTTFVVAAVLVGLFASITNAALMGNHKVHISGLLSPVRIATRSVFQIALVFAGFGLSGMLFGYITSGAVIGVISLVFLSVGINQPRFEHFKSLFDFAKFSWIGSLESRSFNDVDILVLGAFVSPTLVGVYSIAWNITGFIGTFGSSITKTTFPELSQADANQRNDRIASVITDSIAYNGLIGIPGLLGALIVGDRLLLIYGQEFTRGVAVLGLLILAMLLFDYKNQLVNALNATDRPDLSFRVNFTSIVTNLMLNVILVVTFGWVGAAVATVTSAFIGVAVAYWYLGRIVSFKLPLSEIIRQVAAGGIMAIVVVAAQSAVEASRISGYNAILLAILVCLGAAVYSVVLLSISERFRTTVRENIPTSIPLTS